MKKLLTCVALSAIAGAYGQIDRSVRPVAATAPTINIKDSEVFKLANGITVVLSENHKLPRVSFQLVMGGSPIAEGSKAGVNNMMGQLLLSGTTTRSKDVLDKEIDYMGASINADGNSIYASCLKKHMDKTLSIMQDVVANPAFPESEFTRIKKQAESNLLSDKSSPDKMADNAESKVNFPNHPYGDILNEKTLAAITRDDILASYKASFTPDGAYLVIVGDINRADAQKAAETYFANWKGGKVYKTELGKGQFGKANRVIFVNKPGAVQSAISISFPIDMKPGDKNQLPLTVLNGIFGGSGFGTRLMSNLREDKAYTYGAYSGLNVTRDGSWLSASGSFRNEVTDSAITQLLYEFSRITEGYVSDDELALTKATMSGGFARSLESPQTIARFALNIIQNNLPADYYKNYLKNLDAVTKETVLQMAQTYFKNGYNIVVVGNEAVLDKIKQFDADGVIEKLDAFGDVIIDMKKADITADQLIEKYLLATTVSASKKDMDKKLKKIKSVKKIVELKSDQMPMTINFTETFQAPNKEAVKIEAQGMVFMSSYYNGTKGGSSNMQTGKKELTAAELAAKKKAEGLFPEMSYATSGMKYELKGIENQNGVDVYVLVTNDGIDEQYNYYDAKTFLKTKTVSISTEGGETNEQTVSFSDYKEVNGILFAHGVTQMFGPMGLTGVVKTIEVNGKIDATVFE